MDYRWIFLLLIVNGAVALIYFIYRGAIRKEFKKAVVLTVFMLMTPIVGPVFLFLAEAVNCIFFHKHDDLLSEDELSFSKARAPLIIADDVEREINRVPINEAMLVSDMESRRQLFLEVLKRPDADDYIQGIKSAMVQKDSEVVHYAASYITDIIAKYKDGEKNLRQICESNGDAGTLLIYIQFSRKMIKKKIFSIPEQKMYITYLLHYMDQLYQLNKTYIDGNSIGDALSFIHEYGLEGEGKWIGIAAEIMDSDLRAAKEVLKYSFKEKDTKGFQQYIERIKASELVLDSQMLEWLRFYDDHMEKCVDDSRK